MDEHEIQNNTSKSGNNLAPIIAVTGLIIIVVVGALAYQNITKSRSQEPAPTTNEQMIGDEPTIQTQKGVYKDGTYTAVGNYTSPGGAEELGVTLTIENNVITDSEVEVKATRPISKTRQTDFKENYKEQVIGKNIDDVLLTKVSGSSLSPKGFNDALNQVKQQAQQS